MLARLDLISPSPLAGEGGSHPGPVPGCETDEGVAQQQRRLRHTLLIHPLIRHFVPPSPASGEGKYLPQRTYT